jgi:hypothetical protein
MLGYKRIDVQQFVTKYIFLIISYKLVRNSESLKAPRVSQKPGFVI